MLIRDFREMNFTCTNGQTERVYARKDRQVACPIGSSSKNVDGNLTCTISVEANSCGVGNPILPSTGKKLQSETDFSFEGMSWQRSYSSMGAIHQYSHAEPSLSFGTWWRDSYDIRLELIDGSTSTMAAISMPGGRLQYFDLNGAAILGSDSNDARLTKLADGYTVLMGTQYYVFNKTGQLTNVWDLNGKNFRLSYTDGTLGSKGKAAISADGELQGGPVPAGALAELKSWTGRALAYERDLGGRITQMNQPGSAPIRYYYGGDGHLAQVSWPASSNASKFYIYAETAHTSGYSRADALTGVSVGGDLLTAKRFATFEYDTVGRASLTEHDSHADSYAVRHVTPNAKVEVTNPNGGLSTYTYEKSASVVRLTGVSQPGGSGCAATANSLSYDTRGNVLSKVDFNEARSCYGYASDRNVETYRAEGLGKADVCPTDWASFKVDPEKSQRKISTRWHPAFKLETQRAEPKRITTTVYNGQVDPIKKDGVEVTCAAGDPRLPDNNRIAVVCRRYEQSTEDATGNLGFDAAATETRKWSYTYNQYGQVLTETDPRGKVTTNEYWPDTAFTSDGNGFRGHWMGDLKLVKNALQQKTQYVDYDKRGQVLTTQFANGSQELREYHARGWLTKVTQVPAGGGAGQVTQYDYYDTGLLKKVTQPDGSFASYDWDDAHRLTDVTDSVGNKVHYELDNAGNRTIEKFKDPDGNLAKMITRTFDALGRMSSSAGVQ
jgi:YD repeat-containing protein